MGLQYSNLLLNPSEDMTVLAHHRRHHLLYIKQFNYKLSTGNVLVK